MGVLVLLLFLGSVVLPSGWVPLRSLGPERRLRLMAALSLLALGFLRLAGPLLNDAVLAGASRPFYTDLAILIAGLSTALAIGLAGSAVLNDSHKGPSRQVALLFFLVPLLASLCSVGWLGIFAIPVAARTGWARQVAEGRRPLATVAGLIGFIAILLWPPIQPPTGPFWSPTGFPCTSIFQFGQIFLTVQMGMLTMRFLLGLIFGPRRIGRRLLVSHMLAGLFPFALTALLAILISLLAIANFRAAVAVHLLKTQHSLSRDRLEHIVAQTAEDLWPADSPAEIDPSPDRLSDLAQRIASQWRGRRPYWMSSGTSRARACPVLMSGAKPPGSLICVQLRTPSGDFSVCRGDTTILDSMPATQVWLDLPADTLGCGLVRYAGASLHVTNCTWIGQDASLRVQAIESLPHGRVGVLEDPLGSMAQIEESFSLTWDFRIIRDDAADSAFGGSMPMSPENPSTFSSGHVLVSAQRRVPGNGESGGSGRWQRFRLPIRGNSSLADLVPALPTSENPLGYVPIIVLVSTALLFVAVEVFAFVSALRMGRAIAQSVSQLRNGTERLQQGDLAYRLQLRGNDELATLGDAFNEMAEGLEEGQRTALEKERLAGEMALARRIQQRLLPGTPPSVPGLQLAGVSVPAREVGGDYYDFLEIGDDKLLVVMADVSGKGAPAAILMSTLRASLHSMLPDPGNLSELARRLNRLIYASTNPTEFITFFVGSLDMHTGQLTYVNAGHEQPFLIRRDHSLERLQKGGLMLGAFPHADYEETTIRLDTEDLLYLFTDGLTEATDPIGAMFEEHRLATLLPVVADRDPESILRATLEEVRAFVKNAEPSDDITLLAVRKLGPI